MAQHYRRKRTLAALNEMYLTNISRTKSYRDFLVLEKGLISVSEQLKKHEETGVDLSVQLDLFGTPTAQPVMNVTIAGVDPGDFHFGI